MSKTLPTLLEALDAINWSYGRGDVVGVDWDPKPAPTGPGSGGLPAKRLMATTGPRSRCGKGPSTSADTSGRWPNPLRAARPPPSPTREAMTMRER